MDVYDRKILYELQQNGRITNQELSERISLSPSPCLRRVRMMEEAGIIAGYTAIVDQNKIGNSVSLFVRVKIARHVQHVVKEFEDAIKNIDNILFCYLVSGEYDYLLHIVVESLEGYEHLVRESIQTLPGVSEIDSSFAYGTVKRMLKGVNVKNGI